MIIKIMIIGIGGFAGAILRFLLSEGTMRFFGGNFPSGTLVVNIIGSFFLGFLLAIGLRDQSLSPEISALYGTGFLGAFTTFSTFNVDILVLLQEGMLWRAAVYLLASVVGGLSAAAIGYYLGKG